MENEERIAFYSMKPDIIYSKEHIHETYTFLHVNNKYLRWCVTKIKEKLIKKGIIEQYTKDVTTIGECHSITVGYEELFNAIMDDTHARMSLYNEDSRFLIVGVKGMKMLDRLTRETVVYMPTTTMSGNWGLKTIAGLEVLLVPHFDGVLVLPDIEPLCGHNKHGIEYNDLNWGNNYDRTR